MNKRAYINSSINSLIDSIKISISNKGLSFCQIRPHKKIKGETNVGDIDLLVPKEDFARLTEILYEICVAKEHSFVLRHLGKFNTKLYILIGSPGPIVIFDFWSELQVIDPRDNLACWQGLEWQDLSDHMIRSNRGREHQLSPDIGYLVYLTHLFTMKKDVTNTNVQWRILYFRSLLKGQSFEFKVTNDNLDEYCKYALEILGKKKIFTRRNATLRFIKDASLARFERFINKVKTKDFGVIVGVDGSGKTTLVNHISKHHEKHFQKTHFRTLYKDTLFYKLLALPYSKFCKEKNINSYDEKIFFLLSIFVYFKFEYFLKSRPKLQVFDRYFYDFLLVNMALKDAQSPPKRAWWSKFLFCFIPIPKFVIWIWIDYKQSADRKNELNYSQWKAYIEHMNSCVINRKHKTICVLNNRDKIDKSAKNLHYCFEKFLLS